MGAWGHDIFDNDTAYDFTDEIEEDAKSFFKQSFENAMRSAYLGYDEGVAVTVSAAYIDNFLNGTIYRTDAVNSSDISNVNMFRQLYKGVGIKDLLIPAIKSLRKVISGNSELNELWSDNDELYPKWKDSLIELAN